MTPTAGAEVLVETLAKLKWLLWVILAGVCVVVGFALRALFTGPRVPDRVTGKVEPLLPPVPEVIKQKVEQAEEHTLQVKVESRVESAEHREQLQTIGKIEDGAERRRRLAEMLKVL